MPATSYDSIEPFDDFARIIDPTVFAPVADTDLVGLTDVVGSTAAIAAGRYKAVNMAGAAAISAVMNALAGRPFPFVFGGDGASFVVAAEDRTAAAEALARTRAWSEREIGLKLRAALVPVAEIRAAGHDVRVARYQASPSVAFAMFSGGGLAWAEAMMKRGMHEVPARDDAPPDLSGLSCRWMPIGARRGLILSLIARPVSEAAGPAFAAAVGELLALVAAADAREGHPVPPGGPGYRWPPAGLDLEAQASRKNQSLGARRRALWWQTLLALVLFRTGWRLGQFDPGHYRRTVATNSDFRKFDDGLRMTLDCTEATAQALERRLQAAAAAGVLRYGLHRQSAAVMTCIVPSIVTDDHVHFLDGAGGGYAEAAKALK